MGSGYGEPTACFGDYDIMTEDWMRLSGRGLTILRFGDIVLLQNCDTTCGRGYLTARRPSASLSTATAPHGPRSRRCNAADQQNRNF